MDEQTQQDLSKEKTVKALAGNIIALCEGWPADHIAAALAVSLGFILVDQMENPHDVLAQTFDQLTALIDELDDARAGA